MELAILGLFILTACYGLWAAQVLEDQVLPFCHHLFLYVRTLGVVALTSLRVMLYALYLVPFAINAQHRLAFLLANATQALLNPILSIFLFHSLLRSSVLLAA